MKVVRFGRKVLRKVRVTLPVDFLRGETTVRAENVECREMGNHPSAHQPLERATSRAGNALRLSKRERSPGKRMDRLRRSFRDSFRRRKDPESSRPHQWEADEHAVRAGTCAFPVKYLGCVEVYEQRGMQVCEEALKVLRNSRSPPIRGVLHISGDGLRVVDNGRRGLIVDQTIDKVSFCSPDRNHDRAFSYICRDGTTKRWMCHGFIAKESGDRLSHAVGCAFSVCLERKKRENRDNGVSMNFDSNNSTFTRRGSFRQQSVTEQESRERAVDVPPVRQVHNPYAIARPHATPSMLQRQGSCRGFSHLNKASPFKRQLSLRVNDLPSNLERTRSHSLEPTDLARLPPQMAPIPIGLDNRGFDEVSPILEMPAPGQDSVTAMCQQFYRGLSLLSSGDDFGPPTEASTSTVAEQLFTNTVTTSSLLAVSTTGGSLDGTTRSHNGLNINNNNNDKTGDLSILNSADTTWRESSFPLQSTNPRISPIFAKNNNSSISPVTPRTNAPTSVVMSTPAPISINGAFGTPPAAPSPAFSTASTSSLGDTSVSIINRSPLPMNPPITPRTSSSGTSVVSVSPAISAVSASDVGSQISQVPGAIQTPPVEPVPAAPGLPKPEQWLGSVTGSVPAVVQSNAPTSQIQTTPRRAPALHSRALSLGSAAMGSSPGGGKGGPSDPFDAEWADIAARNMRQTSTTNPFVMPNAMQAFQVQL